jgi:hypothetical protein
VTQGTDAKPEVALPVRIHDLLLGLAGRLDDDALADARELLASAELDRSLDFAVGCLVAGRIVVTGAQRDELRALLTRVNLDPVVVDRLLVNNAAAVVRHRFGGGAVGGAQAGDGVTDAARHVLEVLPDVRTVWAVWRFTPAGAVSGPVPHRVVLVGVGPHGFAPATSYRMEDALRRAGIRASVEVLRDGVDPSEYHRAAMQHATQVQVAREASASPFIPSAEQRPELPAPQAPVAPTLSDTPQISRTAQDKPSPSPSRRSDRPERAGPTVPPADDSLSEQERELLRQLQEELARREQESGGAVGGREPGGPGGPGLHDWLGGHTKPSMVNGVPPHQDPDQRH